MSLNVDKKSLRQLLDIIYPFKKIYSYKGLHHPYTECHYSGKKTKEPMALFDMMAAGREGRGNEKHATARLPLTLSAPLVLVQTIHTRLTDLQLIVKWKNM